MKKYVFLLAVLIAGIQSFAQRTVIAKGIEYEVFFPSKTLKSEINNALQIRYHLLSLKTHPELNLNKEQLENYSKLLDIVEKNENTVFIDSLSIVLMNGLAWNLNLKPTFLSKEFYKKVKRKKYINDSDVISGLKYLQFCDMWIKEGELPRFMVDKFIYYQRIDIDGVNYLKIEYEIKYKPEGKGTFFTSKEIKLTHY